MKILIIDKDITSCYYYMVLMETLSNSVLLALNGKMAKDLISCIDFDIIISDIYFPDVNGITLMEDLMNIRPEAILIIQTSNVF